VEVVELGSQEHLGFVVEGRVVAEVQVIEVCRLIDEVQVIEVESVEREDFGDFVPLRLRPPAARCATYPHHACYGRRTSEKVLGQAEMSSYRDHNVIWTLGRYRLTDGPGNLGPKTQPIL
jgi:hypothetical protein